MVLARIDGAIIVVVFATYDIFTRFRKHKRLIMYPSLIFCSVAVLVSSCWWYYNYKTFGSLMPISGQSESISNLQFYNFLATGNAVADILLMIIYFPHDYLNAGITSLYFLTAVLFATLVFRRLSLWKLIRKNFDVSLLLPLFFGSILLLVYYLFFFSAPHFISRYLQPLRVFWLIIVSLALPLIWKFMFERIHRKTAYFLLTIFISGIFSFNSYGYIRNFIIQSVSPAYLMGLWAKEHPQEQIGMTSSGTAGFVSDNVINLDGKVNADALKARHEQRLGDYVVFSGITILADWEGNITMMREQMSQPQVEFRHFDNVDDIGLYRVIR